MRLVIDSNKLRSPDLHDFLAESVENFAILTDYAWMEAYKGDPLLSISKSLAILCDFPQQVLILKGTKAIGALDARSPGLADRMIWKRSDAKFSETVAGLRAAQRGDLRPILAMQLHSEAARKQMAKTLADAEGILGAMSEMQDIYTKAEIAEIRSGAPYSVSVARKMFDSAEYMTFNLFKRHPFKLKQPSLKSLPNTYLFRYALATNLFLMHWIRGGSQQLIKPEKTQNSTIDLIFAVYGTYFNGLLTDDRFAGDIHAELRVVLKIFGARLPKEYLSFFD